jgi:hypothetical protein
MIPDGSKKKRTPQPGADIDQQMRAMGLIRPAGGVDAERSAIESGAKELGVDPVDYATAMSYETGGTFNPWQPGPVTKWGQHRGTIQYGEPQRAKYGVYEGQPFEEQVTKSNVRYLKDAGVKPGATFEQLYKAINGGSVNKAGSTPDADTGRTIDDNIRNALRDHRAKVMARYGWQDKPQSAAGFDFDTFATDLLRPAANSGRNSQPSQDPNKGFDFDRFSSDLLGKVAGNPSSNEVPHPAMPQQVKPVPETANTINEQVLSAMNPASPRSAVLLTDKSQLPLLNSMSRFTRISLPEGDLFVNARKLKVKPKDVPGYVKQNGFANLIGKVEDVGNNTAQGTALRSEDENGNELNTSIVSHEKIHSQALADVAQFPDKVANQEVLPAQDAVQKRVDELTGIGEAAKRGERYVPDQPDMPQMEQSGGDPYQEYLKEFPNFAKQGEKPLSNEEFNSKLADAEKAGVGKGAQAVEYTTQPHIAITPAKPVSPANKTGGKQPQQPTPAKPVNPQSKEVSATVAWMAGRGDAREYAFDDAASKIAKQIGVDYAAARQYIGRNQFQQGPLSSERAERAKRGRHEITIALDPAAVNELKAIDSRNKATLALYNSKLDEYGKTEIPTIADLLARKDAGLNK